MDFILFILFPFSLKCRVSHCSWFCLVRIWRSEGFEWRVALGNQQRERLLRANPARGTLPTTLVISNATYASIWHRTLWSHSVVICSVGHAFIGGSTITPILRSAPCVRHSCRKRNWFPFMAGEKHRLIPGPNHILGWRSLTVLRGRGRKRRRRPLLRRPIHLGIMGSDWWVDSFPWQLPGLETSRFPLLLVVLSPLCLTFTSMDSTMPLSMGQLLVIPLGLTHFRVRARGVFRRQPGKCSGRRTMFWRICSCWLDSWSFLRLFLFGNIVLLLSLWCFSFSAPLLKELSYVCKYFSWLQKVNCMIDNAACLALYQLYYKQLQWTWMLPDFGQLFINCCIFVCCLVRTFFCVIPYLTLNNPLSSSQGGNWLLWSEGLDEVYSFNH